MAFHSLGQLNLVQLTRVDYKASSVCSVTFSSTTFYALYTGPEPPID